MNNDAVACANVEINLRSPNVTVWCGSMPESNGKENWSVILRRTKDSIPEGVHKHDQHRLLEGFCIYRTEYRGRAEYEADRLRFIIGETDVWPDILAYDSETHSDYIPPPETPAVMLTGKDKGVTYTKDEVHWLMTSPQGLDAVADYHSWQETMANASGDYPEAEKFHADRRKQLNALAQEIQNDEENA